MQTYALPQIPGLSQVVLPEYQGCISVTPNGRYFQDEAGRGFVVIGHNDAVTWPGLETLLERSAPEVTEAYIQDLRAHGINVSRIMIEYAQFPHGYFENPVGTFSETLVQFWDDFIALSEKHGLYLLLTPYDTFWQVKKWNKYPYNANVGGPVADKCDWLLSPESITAQKNRWEFVIRRWGGSPNIFGWDLMNEIDLYWGCTPEQISAYLSEMAAFVRSLEREVWGRAHMLTASAAAPVPDGALGEVIYNHPDLDFANTHLYVGSEIKRGANAARAGVAMAQGVQQSLEKIRQPRPYFDSESGPIDKWIKDPDLDREYHHNMSFAHLASGGAGSGMRWPYTRPHHLLPEMRDNLLGLARFAAAVDWTNFDSRNITEQVKVSDDRVICAACADDQTAVLWLLRNRRKNSSLEGVVVEVDAVLRDGAYIVELWETYSGCEFARLVVLVRDGKLRFTVRLNDLGLDDVAIHVRAVHQ